MSTRKYDLEDRLIEYTCRMIDVVAALPDTKAGNYIALQLIKSSHSPAFNYGEAQAAESAKDFVHKLGIVLKIERMSGRTEDHYSEANDKTFQQTGADQQRNRRAHCYRSQEHYYLEEK